MIIYVAGARDYADKRRLKAVLDGVHADRPVTLLIEGGNLGAHRWAFYWATSTGGIKTARVEPKQMADESIRCAERRTNREALDMGVELLVAFPGGFRTRDMVAQAEARGIRVIQP
jgi:hypothetical protein